MAENFFLDNLNLQYHLDKVDLREVVEIKEKGYTNVEKYPTAPRHYEDAKDNYRLLLEVLGEICATVIAPRAAEADEEGRHRRVWPGRRGIGALPARIGGNRPCGASASERFGGGLRGGLT